MAGLSSIQPTCAYSCGDPHIHLSRLFDGHYLHYDVRRVLLCYMCGLNAAVFPHRK